MAEVRPGYETADVNVKAVLWVVLTLVVVVGLSVAALGGLVGLFDLASEPAALSPLARLELRPPPPRLDPRPQATLAEVQGRETAALQRYGWVDRDQGIARIPIEEAMQLLAARGWTSKAEPDPGDQP